MTQNISSTALVPISQFPLDGRQPPPLPVSTSPAALSPATLQSLSSVIGNATQALRQVGDNSTSRLENATAFATNMLQSQSDALVQKIIVATNNATLAIQQQTQTLFQSIFSASLNATTAALQVQQSSLAASSNATANPSDLARQLVSNSNATTNAIVGLQGAFNSSISSLVDQNRATAANLVSAAYNATSTALADQDTATANNVFSAAFNATFAALQEGGNSFLSQVVDSTIGNTTALLDPQGDFAMQLTDAVTNATTSALQGQVGAFAQNATNMALNTTLSSFVEHQQNLFANLNETLMPITDLSVQAQALSFNIGDFLDNAASIIQIGANLNDAVQQASNLTVNSTNNLIGNISSITDAQNQLVGSPKLRALEILGIVGVAAAVALFGSSHFRPADDVRKTMLAIAAFTLAGFGIGQFIARAVLGQPTLGSLTG